MPTKNKKKLFLLELNEINFDVVKIYIKKYKGKYQNLEKLYNLNKLESSSEKKYTEIEPWIQWASVHTGLSFEQHKIYRLGDIVNFKKKQIFELVEEKKFEVGCISPMNTSNNLKNPSYFIPDPWTITKSDGSWWSSKLTKVIKQSVNDNSQSRITISSFFYFFLAFLRFSQFKNYAKYLKLFLRSYKSPWCKALFLDLFLSDLHLSYFKKKKPSFSVLFLNAAAHIQHHYFFNFTLLESKLKNPSWYCKPLRDPFLDVLDIYNVIIGDHMILKASTIIATGMSQVQHNEEVFYYRLKNHENFIKRLGIKNFSLFPRMTRDFLINFSSTKDALAAEQILNNIKIYKSKLRLFGEIDNRGRSLFITLTYPKKIDHQTKIFIDNKLISLSHEVVFVAIKNGKHQEKGYVFLSKDINILGYKNGFHVKGVFEIILNYFNS
jgi:hypothetical protein